MSQQKIKKTALNLIYLDIIFRRYFISEIIIKNNNKFNLIIIYVLKNMNF